MSHLVSIFLFFLAIISIIISIRCSNSKPNPLNGKHLRVIWARWSGNPKGLPGPVKGGVLIDILSTRFNFTYEMVRVTEYRTEPTEKGRGLFNYLWDQQSDLLVHDTIPSVQRNKIVDLTLPWIYDSFAFLISLPDETANINAVVKPFQWPVWLGLVVSIVCVIAVFNLIQRYLEYKATFELGNNDKPQSAKSTKHKRTKWQTGEQYLYVFGNLVSQGGTCPSNRLPLRLVAGVWTLATFIFVQAYTSLLFTYVVTPINYPLINSVYDIIDHPDINLLVKEDGFINILVSSYNESGIYRTLRGRLDSFPKSRCALASECINLITRGSRNVFVDSRAYIKDEIRKNYRNTGKCNFQLAKEVLRSSMSSLALPKSSPYTQVLSKGVLEVQEMGLPDFWDTWFRPMPPQCNGKPQSGNKDKKLAPLNLKNVTGAFIVLLVGLSLSLLAFLFEKIHAAAQK